jgi:magnesium-transporting ATPase (P-type)
MMSDNSSVIVYVGDSPTDMSALIEADIGIVMGNSSSTKMIAARWSIQIVPLQHRDQHGFGSILDGDLGIGHKKLLWQAESWKEIDDMLIQLDQKVLSKVTD